MADGDVARQPIEVLLPEGVGHEPHVCEVPQRAPVAGGDTGALLSAVLEREDTEKSDACCVAVGAVREVDPDDATLLLRGVGGVGSYVRVRAGHAVLREHTNGGDASNGRETTNGHGPL